MTNKPKLTGCLPIFGQPQPAFHFLFIFLTTIVSLTAAAQCSASNAHEGNTFANDNTTGSINYTNTFNASLVDGNYAEAATTLSLSGSATTKYLKATNFNFSIPAGATICGIVLEMHKRGSGVNLLNSITDNEVNLVVDGAITGNNQAANTDWNSTDFTETYGSSNDLWGTTLTPDIINNANFGVAISASFSGLVGSSLTAEIDAIAITVFYNPNIVLPIIVQSFTGDISDDDVILQWSTTEEEDHAYVAIQRSEDNINWLDIYKQNGQKRAGNHYYEYVDKLTYSGNYYYRLKIVSTANAITYSPIVRLPYNDMASISVFPNPSQATIMISNVNKSDKVYLINTLQQRFDVPKHQIAKHTVQMNVIHLPTGLYFIKVGKKTVKFFKN